MRNRWIVIIGLFLLVALLALLLQGIVRSTLLVPAMYALWLARSLFRSISQLTYWHLLTAGLALIAVLSLIGGWGLFKRSRRNTSRQQGPIEQLADNIRSMDRGVYYRWLVAHQLGDLARLILIEQEGEHNLPPRTLVGHEWHPPEDVQEYLEAGLERWVVFYPQRRFFLPPPPTPLDVNLDTVIDYLESQMETDRER